MRVAALAGVGLCLGTGCAHPPPQPPLAYVVPVIGLPPIPIDTTRPGLDVRPMPTAEAVAAVEHTVRLAPEAANALLERRPVRLGSPHDSARPGYVRFRVIIGRDGTIKGLTLIESTNSAFTTAATASVQSWQYHPCLVNGKPIAVDTYVRVDFAPPE